MIWWKHSWVFAKCVTEYAEFGDKNICHYSKSLEPATSCVRDQDATVKLRKWYLAFCCYRSHSPSSSCLSKGSSEWNPIKSNKYLDSHTFIYSKQMLFSNSTYMHHIEQLFRQLTNSESKLVTMSVSLCTQTGLHCLIIHVLNIKSLLPKYLSHFCTQ